MLRTTIRGGWLAVAILLLAGTPGAQGPSGRIEERIALENESVRIVLLTYHPGTDSDLHLNPGPEITLVQDGELALYTPQGRQALGPGSAHWLPATTAHLARNEAGRPVRFWSLLLKRCE